MQPFDTVLLLTMSSNKSANSAVVVTSINVSAVILKDVESKEEILLFHRERVCRQVIRIDAGWMNNVSL